MSHCVWIPKTEDAASNTGGLLGLWWVNGFLLGSTFGRDLLACVGVSACLCVGRSGTDDRSAVDTLEWGVWSGAWCNLETKVSLRRLVLGNPAQAKL